MENIFARLLNYDYYDCEIITAIAKQNGLDEADHVGADHIHTLVSIPPYFSMSKLVQYS